ncbi:hypothetical protein TNCV_4861611 [Trichonephila clavipes]|nr:hypothetical protein TNCV_4861611 [Trichonephila clavipes]
MHSKRSATKDPPREWLNVLQLTLCYSLEWESASSQVSSSSLCRGPKVAGCGSILADTNRRRDLLRAIHLYDMAAVDFLHPENPSTWAGIEPTTLENWMACDAEDCGFQMLNDDEIVISVQESDPVDDEMDEDEDNNKESSKGS